MDDLRQRMAALVETGDYFVRRDRPGKPDFEAAYWHEVVDPDGVARNRLEERERHLEDIDYIVDFVRTLEPGKVLDVGCGPGFFLSALDLAWRRHGIELSEFAAERASRQGDIHVGTLLDGPYGDDEFDLVLMHHVIEHCEDPVANIEVIRRILKRDGCLVIATPDFDSGCARLFGANYRLLADETHIRLFSSDSMHRFMRDHEFRIRRVEYPFFDTRYFTEENLLRLSDTTTVSPPFYGNFMTFFCDNAKD